MHQELGDDEGLPTIEFRQNIMNMNGASKEFERAVVAGTLYHGMNPVLRWMLGNVSIYQDGNGNIRPDKKKSTEKIDGIVATIMGIGSAMEYADDDLITAEDFSFG